MQDLEKRIKELETIVNDLVKFQTLLLHSFNYLGKDEQKFKTNIKRLK